MPAISKHKRERISEQILHYLFSVSPESRFTAEIALELARDEEFIKSLLDELKEKKLIVEITKSSKGQEFSRRKRWRLSNEVYEAYSKIQKTQNSRIL